MKTRWQERTRPARLEGRYEFASYADLRDFLDEAAKLSEQEDYYPDMGFGRDYVNITIHAQNDGEQVSVSRRSFAEKLDQLSGAKTN